jgi:sugar/nucleoside kinase (ribokinase family)
MTAPDYVVVGHVTKDLVPGGYRVGGTVTFAGLTARRLGCRVGVLTSAGSDLDIATSLPGVEVVVVPAEHTTTFENTYDHGRRRQFLRSVAGRIEPQHVPEAWRDAPIVHFGPLAQEFGPELVAAFPGARVRGITPQGWLRQWDDSGLVSRVDADRLALNGALSQLDAVILSEEDVSGDWELLRRYSRSARLLVVTQGARGATICEGARCSARPAFSVTEVDPTGAGDVFAAAYLIHLQATGDVAEAAVFANCAASFAVEGPGTSTLPDLSQVQARLEASRR